MPSLYECMKLVRELVASKLHEDVLEESVINGKLLYAIVEISEAIQLIKKHGIKLPKQKLEKFLEELIDAIFYILDVYGIYHRDLKVENPDSKFMKKYEANMKREIKYGRPTWGTYTWEEDIDFVVVPTFAVYTWSGSVEHFEWFV